MAEGRGGVVKLSFTTDWVPNLQRSRGMKRRRFIYNPKTSKDYRRELRRRRDANHLSQRTGDSRDAIREQSRLRES